MLSSVVRGKPKLAIFPSLEEDPLVQQERQQFGQDSEKEGAQ